MARFSKAALVFVLDVQMRTLETDYRLAAGRRLDPSNGTAQIPAGNKDAAVTFGEWRALRALRAAVAGGEVAL